jgi:peptidylamidoglycolate lyase
MNTIHFAKWFVLFSILFVVQTFGQAFGQAEPSDYIQVPNWPSLPSNFKLGQVTGVAVDAGSHVYVFHRSDRTWTTPFPKEAIHGQTIAVFEAKTGKLLSTLGNQTFIMPHGLSIDNNGYLWLTDVGSHQVLKIDPQSGKVLLTLGTAGVSGVGRSHFGRPTDVGFSRDGTIFVADGYSNTRIVRFSPAGKYLGEWGTPGSQAGEFNLPHGITVSRNRVYVCDRSNLRVQVFNLKGRYLDQWQGSRIGRPFGIATDQRNRLCIIDGGDQPDHTRSRVVILNSHGKIWATFNTAKSGDSSNLGHDIAVDGKGAIYVADAWGNHIRKFIPNTKQKRASGF